MWISAYAPTLPPDTTTEVVLSVFELLDTVTPLSAVHVDVLMVSAGLEIVEPGLQVKYRPYEADLKACRELGVRLAEFALERSE